MNQAHVENKPASVSLANIWRDLDLPAGALAGVTLSGADPMLPSSFRMGSVAAVSIAAAAAAAGELHRLRTGVQQKVAIAFDHACAEFRSERFLTVDGEMPPSPWDKIVGAYLCRDGRWVRIHTNFPHHRDGILALLGCAYEKEAVAAAMLQWSSADFEEAATKAGMISAVERSYEEWQAHPQAQASADLPLIGMERIGDSSAEPLAPGRRPLEGVRVLELARIIAGPVAGRTLAAHGATVLRVIGEGVPTVETLDIDNGRGKLSAHLDLKTGAGRARFEELIAGADVVLQSYRPGALDALGFGADRIAAIRPGIVAATLSAYQPVGPWRAKRGFDSIVQTATGFNRDEGVASGAGKPTPFPAQALDHGAGHLLAFGVITALIRRHQQGGSWLVSTSLSQVGRWLRGLGRVSDGFAISDPALEAVRPFLETSQSGWGEVVAVRHAAVMSETPPHWATPTMPYGSHAATWPERASAEVVAHRGDGSAALGLEPRQ